MWFLEPAGRSENNNAVFYLVASCSSVGRPHKIVGMPGADVLVSGDSSVSKLHANLLLSERSGVSEGEQRPILVIRGEFIALELRLDEAQWV